MLRTPIFSTIIVSLYLLVYYILFNLQVNPDIITLMFILAPFLVLWMIITILKDKNYRGKELEENEEWGYGDKEKNSLGTF